jgi:hypothetical protein
MANGSLNTVAANSKPTRCACKLASALALSHSNSNFMILRDISSAVNWPERNQALADETVDPARFRNFTSMRREVEHREQEQDTLARLELKAVG